jgi:hypothetical protein
MGVEGAAARTHQADPAPDRTVPVPADGVSLEELRTRLGAYVEAEKQAKEAGDSAKTRR